VPRPVRLYLVTHAVALREMVAVALDGQDAFDVVGQCSSGAQALAALPRVDADLAVVTRRLPDMTGVELARRLHRQLPDVRVLLLSTVCDEELLAEALDAGAAGVATAWADRAALDDALLRAARGETVAPADVLRRLLRAGRARDDDPLAPLTPLEREIVSLISQGLTNPEIAVRLRLAHGTVRNYVSRLMTKIGVRRRAQLVALATRHGLGAPPVDGEDVSPAPR
jgi:two-component system, NarL family, response regulator DevR